MEVIAIDSLQFALSGSCLSGVHTCVNAVLTKMASLVGERDGQLVLLCVDSHVKFG